MNFVLTMSGGTTPVINSTLVGVIHGIQEHYPKSKIFIPKPGIIGLLNKSMYVIREDIDNDILNRLKLLPGSSITGTSRIEILDKETISKIAKILNDLNVKVYINIGGSGTIKQSMQLSKEFEQYGISFIALPKTIDNDLGDYSFKDLAFTPGYLSAAKYIKKHIINLMRENDGAYYNDKVLVTQMFGRDTSFLSAIAGTIHDTKERLLLLFPESPVSCEKFLFEVQIRVNLFGGCIIVVPEGYPADAFNIEFSKEFDESGQIKWGSSHSSISQIITNYLNNNGIKTRLCNTTIEQRQTQLLDETDVHVAYTVGYNSIKYFKNGIRNFFSTVKINDGNFTFDFIELNNLNISKFNRKLPKHFISEDSFDVNFNFIKYFSSLNPGNTIIGESYIPPHLILRKYEI